MEHLSREDVIDAKRTLIMQVQHFDIPFQSGILRDEVAVANERNAFLFQTSIEGKSVLDVLQLGSEDLTLDGATLPQWRKSGRRAATSTAAPAASGVSDAVRARMNSSLIPNDRGGGWENGCRRRWHPARRSLTTVRQVSAYLLYERVFPVHHTTVERVHVTFLESLRTLAAPKVSRRCRSAYKYRDLVALHTRAPSPFPCCLSIV